MAGVRTERSESGKITVQGNLIYMHYLRQGFLRDIKFVINRVSGKGKGKTGVRAAAGARATNSWFSYDSRKYTATVHNYSKLCAPATHSNDIFGLKQVY